MNIFWTDAKVARLKAGYLSTHSLHELALSLGCTKNSAVGKARRLGLRYRNENQTPAFKNHISLGAENLPRGTRLCQFPQGDPKDEDFAFCGQPVLGRGPYCEPCREIAYTKPKKRADKEPNYSANMVFSAISGRMVTRGK